MLLGKGFFFFVCFFFKIKVICRLQVTSWLCCCNTSYNVITTLIYVDVQWTVWILWWHFARSPGKFCEYSLGGIELSQAFGTRQPLNVNVSPQQVTATGPEVQVPAAVQRYLLDINLKQGKNLVIRDKRSGRSPTCMWAIITGLLLPVQCCLFRFWEDIISLKTNIKFLEFSKQSWVGRWRSRYIIIRFFCMI